MSMTNNIINDIYEKLIDLDNSVRSMVNDFPPLTIDVFDDFINHAFAFDENGLFKKRFMEVFDRSSKQESCQAWKLFEIYKIMKE